MPFFFFFRCSFGLVYFCQEFIVSYLLVPSGTFGDISSISAFDSEENSNILEKSKIELEIK